MISVEGAIRIKESYPTITVLIAVIIVTEYVDDLLSYPTLHFYFAFKVIKSLMLEAPNDSVVARFEV